MGFFGLEQVPTIKKAQSLSRGLSVQALHRHECNMCPLNGAAHVETAKMKPAGVENPLVYLLGGVPSREADGEGVPFAGDDYRFYRAMLPANLRNRVRWNNVVRTYTGKGKPVASANKDNPGDIETTRDPTMIEIECCRPSIVRDIERTKPVAIFGFGSIPLRWVAGETHPSKWQGRRFPVKVGEHVCWYYPFVTFNDIEAKRRWHSHTPDEQTHFERCMLKAFKSLQMKDRPPIHVTTPDEAREGCEIITGAGGKLDLKRWKQFIKLACEEKITGLDYETNMLRPYNDDAKLLTAGVAIKGRAVSIALHHKGAQWPESWMADEALEIMEEYMYSDSRKAVHQLAFEMEWSAIYFGKDVLRAGLWHDTLSQAYVMNSTQGMLALEVLCQQYWGFNIKDLSPVNRKDLDGDPLDVVLLYNAMDAKYHRKLSIKQMPMIDAMGLRDVYDHQLRRIPALVLTQMKGISTDQAVFADFRKKYVNEMKAAEETFASLECVAKFARKFGTKFNPGSNPDVLKMMKLIGHPTTKTDIDALRGIDHPFVKALFKHRKPAKLVATYCDPVTEGAEDSHIFHDHKIHPIISTTKVETWRTSSEEPNIQNWPKRGPNVVIRKGIVASPGCKIVSFDYAGIQARGIAMESRDKNFIDVWNTGYDIHKDWVERIAEAYPKWAPKGLATDKGVFKAARGGVKNEFVFPTFFGAKGGSISNNLRKSGNCPVPASIITELQEELFEQFPDIKKWQDHVVKFYNRHGYVTGLSGHRRFAPIGYNQIINSPIQADEARIVLTAHCELSELDYTKYQPMMEIHDDLTFDVPIRRYDETVDVILREMTKVRFPWINVPLVVEMSQGDNWCDMKEVGKYVNNPKGGGYIEYHE